MSSEDEKPMKKAVNKQAKEEDDDKKKKGAKGGKKEEPPKKVEAPKKGKRKNDDSEDEQEVQHHNKSDNEDEDDHKKGKKGAKGGKKEEPPKKQEAPKKGGKKKHDESDDEEEQKQKPQQQSDDEDNNKKGKKAPAKGGKKEEVPKKVEAPKKGKKRQDDSDEEEQVQQHQKPQSDDEDDDDHKKSKKAPAKGKKEEPPKKQEAPKKAAKKKHDDSDDEDEHQQSAKGKKEEPPKKLEAPKKAAKKKHGYSDDEDEKPQQKHEDDEEIDTKPKGGKKAPASKPAAKKSEAPKKATKKKQDDSDEEDQDKEEDDEFKVAQFTSKKANDKAKKELEKAKKEQAANKGKASTQAAKKPSNNQFDAAVSDEESEDDDSDEEVAAKPKVEAKKDNKKPADNKANMFAFSGSEDEDDDEDEDESEEDEEELERERLKKEQEEKQKKEEQERKRKEDEDRKKAAAEKKRLQQELKKKEEEDQLAALLAAVNTKKESKKEDKAEKKEAEDAEDGEEGEEGEEGEKKLTKNQLKKLKEKQKKEAGTTATAVPVKDDKKKKGPVNKAAQAALEKLQKQQQEKAEQERLEAELKRQEEEEERQRLEELKRIEEEKKRNKEEKKRLIKEGLLKTKDQLKKEEDEKFKREALLNQFGVAPKIEDIKQAAEAKPSIPKKKKVKKDIFGVVIQEEEVVKQEKVEIKVLDFEGDDWEALIEEPLPVNPPTSIESKEMSSQSTDSQQIEQTQQQKDEQKLAEENARKALSKKELAELEKAEKEAKKAAMLEKIYQGQKKNKKVEEKKEILRSPIVCILGHVDTGKTTLLDKLRRTNVQAGEAGGITQQIGATYFPGENIIAETNKCLDFYPVEVKAPGLLVIDTPGHESFSNLRTRGSSLCDFAILVIDLMHGIEQQTLESLQLLKMRKTPFVIAMNKIDRTYSWKAQEFGSSYKSLNDQSRETNNDFQHRFQQIITQLAENHINAALFWDNPDPKTYFPIVPTSGVTGEGIPDLLSVIIKYTSMYMKSRMMVKEDAFNCTVMEVKKIDGLGVTIDAILVDGTIRKDDRIVLLGFNGPIKTKIRALLTPHPMKEMRVKGEYEHHDVIHASMGIKISAPELEMAVAGSQLYLANTQEEEDLAIDLINNDLDMVKKKVKLSVMGVGVAASTLGSLEALLNFLDKSKIPVSYVSVGPVSKDDITKALKSVLADDPTKRKKEFACMLVFDVKVLPDALKYAEDNGVKIFTANIIYHLFDHFVRYVKECQEERKAEEGKAAIFPCIIKPIQFFNKADPIIMGVDVERGTLKPGTPVCLFNNTKLKIGVVESIESEKKSVPFARKETGSVAIRIKGSGNLMAGRQFTEKDLLVSMLTRTSIDALKDHYRDEVTKDEWLFIKEKLKPFFNIL